MTKIIWHFRRWRFGSVFRFNGGGYLYGANPYRETSYGFFTIRRYLK